MTPWGAIEALDRRVAAIEACLGAKVLAYTPTAKEKAEPIPEPAYKMSESDYVAMLPD